jgi:hypothetical protein
MNEIDFVKSDCADYAVHTGASFLIDLQLLQDCVGLPVNLTGYSAAMKICDEDDETDILTTIVGSIADPLAGIIHFELTATQTGALTIGEYVHQIDLTSAGGVVYRVSEGRFEVKA